MIGGGWEVGPARRTRWSQAGQDVLAAVAFLAFVACALAFGGMHP